MNEGSIFTVLIFPQTWPQDKEIIIFKKKHGNCLIQISGLPSGRLLIHIGSEIFASQKITFKKFHRAQISLFWNISNKTKITVYLNSIELSSMNNKKKFIIVSKEQETSDEPSFDHPNIDDVCEKWVSWRKDKYFNKIKKPNNDGYLISKSNEREVKDLENSLMSLESHLKIFNDNDELLLQNILPCLRSLLCWRGNNIKGYNPLLFRVAGRLNLPLPIFAYKNRMNHLNEDSLFDSAKSIHINNRPSITQNFENEKLMDLQEWLCEKIIRDESKVLTWNELILDSANKIASHFAEDSYIVIEDMCNSISMGRSVFTNYLHSISGVTLDLGNYIIQKAKE